MAYASEVERPTAQDDGLSPLSDAFASWVPCHLAHAMSKLSGAGLAEALSRWLGKVSQKKPLVEPFVRMTYQELRALLGAAGVKAADARELVAKVVATSATNSTLQA